MIEYDRSDWWGTVLRFRGTVLPRVLGRVGALTLFTLGLCLIDDYTTRAYGMTLPALDQLGHSVLGVVLGLLIVFRTSSSNSRYWDGRSFWGVLINNARNLARLAANNAPPPNLWPT